jgi:cytochrome P450
MDSATEFLFGQSVGTLVSNRSTAATQFSKDYHEAQDGVIKRARLGVLIHLYPGFKRNFDRAAAGSRGYVGQFAQRAILSRKSQTGSEKLPNCFLTQLAELTTDETEITDQLLNVLLAGRDTTAGLLSIQFHILARRPDVWAKLRAEVSTLGGEVPSLGKLRDLRYVSWTVNESVSSPSCLIPLVIVPPFARHN